MSNYIYIHGFASSPHSRKADYLKERFKTELNISLEIPDLNQGDFSNFTLTRSLAQIQALLEGSDKSFTLIGSSLGGLISALLAEQFTQVERLILLAPAFDFLSLWLKRLGEDTLKQWQENNSFPVYHYGEMKTLLLNYQFITDATQYSSILFQRPLPTLIIHGIEDETVPIEVSRHYAASRSWVELLELPSDHNLTDVLPEIWDYIAKTIPALNLGAGYNNDNGLANS